MMSGENWMNFRSTFICSMRAKPIAFRVKVSILNKTKAFACMQDEYED